MKVLLEILPDKPIAKIQLNSPTTLNAISPEMIHELREICQSINQNPEISVVILTGKGRAFCSGGNVKEMNNPEGPFQKTAAEVEEFYREIIHELPRTLMALKVPIIAAINGATVGAGFDMALMCDFRLAAEESVLAQGFIRLGLTSGDGGNFFLPRLLGYPKACEVALCGETISPHQAKQLGIIKEVYPKEDLLKEAQRLAAQIAQYPREALCHTKELLQKSLELDKLEDFLALTAQKQAALHKSEAHQQRVQDFLTQKKGPRTLPVEED